MDAQTDISNWIASIPKITRWWFFSFFIIPLTTRLGLLDPMSLVMFPDMALGRFQVSYTLLAYLPSLFRSYGILKLTVKAGSSSYVCCWCL